MNRGVCVVCIEPILFNKIFANRIDFSLCDVTSITNVVPCTFGDNGIWLEIGGQIRLTLNGSCVSEGQLKHSKL